MNNGRSYQQKLVADRLIDNWEKTLRYNDDLDKRTTLITGASSIIVGVVVAAKFLPERSESFSFESVLLGSVCGCSVLMYWFAVKVWRSSIKSMPGSPDPVKLHEQYIAKSEDVAFNNALIDLGDAFSKCLEENKSKAVNFDRMVIWFQAQLGLLALAITASAFLDFLNSVGELAITAFFDKQVSDILQHIAVPLEICAVVLVWRDYKIRDSDLTKKGWGTMVRNLPSPHPKRIKGLVLALSIAILAVFMELYQLATQYLA